MQWNEIDLDTGLWTIPETRMKGGVTHEVPLPPIAVEILKLLPRWSGPYVFSTTSGVKPISNFSKVKLRIDTAMKEQIAPWTFHDLRRTMRTALGALPSNVVEIIIAHAQPGLHQVYDRHSYRDEKRRALELWANRLAALVEPNDNNVIQITARG